MMNFWNQWNITLERAVSGQFSPLHAPFPLRDLPLRSIVFLPRPLTAPLHPIFGSLRSVFRSAHMLCWSLTGHNILSDFSHNPQSKTSRDSLTFHLSHTLVQHHCFTPGEKHPSCTMEFSLTARLGLILHSAFCHPFSSLFILSIRATNWLSSDVFKFQHTEKYKIHITKTNTLSKREYKTTFMTKYSRCMQFQLKSAFQGHSHPNGSLR